MRKCRFLLNTRILESRNFNRVRLAGLKWSGPSQSRISRDPAGRTPFYLSILWGTSLASSFFFSHVGSHWIRWRGLVLTAAAKLKIPHLWHHAYMSTNSIKRPHNIKSNTVQAETFWRHPILDSKECWFSGLGAFFLIFGKIDHVNELAVSESLVKDKGKAIQKPTGDFSRFFGCRNLSGNKP